ncbi:MAG: hypothetical protein QOG76_5477, partial [Pseudonocardiales bacterium]|nr:hypothetical protein [Pseudonocardiales bacterium]
SSAVGEVGQRSDNKRQLFELNTGVFAVTRAPRRAGPAD